MAPTTSTSKKRKAEAFIPKVNKFKRLPSWDQLVEREDEILEALKRKRSGVTDYLSYNEENLVLLTGLSVRKYEELYHPKSQEKQLYQFPPTVLVNGNLHQFERRQPGSSVAKLLRSVFDETLQPLVELKTLISDHSPNSARLVDFAVMPNPNGAGSHTKKKGACDLEGNPWPKAVFMIAVSRTLDEMCNEVQTLLETRSSTIQLFVIFKYYPSTGAMLALLFEELEVDGKLEFAAEAFSFGLAPLDSETLDWLKEQDVSTTGVGFGNQQYNVPGKEEFSLTFGNFRTDEKNFRPEVVLDLYAVQRAIVSVCRR